MTTEMTRLAPHATLETMTTAPNHAHPHLDADNAVLEPTPIPEPTGEWDEPDDSAGSYAL
jgi:GTPase